MGKVRSLQIQDGSRWGKGAECWCTFAAKDEEYRTFWDALYRTQAATDPSGRIQPKIIKLINHFKVLWPSVGVSSIWMVGPKNARTAYYGDGSGAAKKSGPTKRSKDFWGNLVKGGVWDSIFLILIRGVFLPLCSTDSTTSDFLPFSV